jgi:flagellar motility protein MotE (MotC chaperone)
MIRDFLRLDVDFAAFHDQMVQDIEFVNSALEATAEKFAADTKFIDREIESDNLLDAEWQFSQLLNEIASNQSPYSKKNFPEAQAIFDRLKKDSARRKKQLEDSCVSTERTVMEPVVSHAELHGLLGSA